MALEVRELPLNPVTRVRGVNGLGKGVLIPAEGGGRRYIYSAAFDEGGVVGRLCGRSKSNKLQLQTLDNCWETRRKDASFPGGTYRNGSVCAPWHTYGESAARIQSSPQGVP